MFAKKCLKINTLYILVTLFFLYNPIVAEDTVGTQGSGFDIELGRFHIAYIPKLLEDGLQNDFQFGFFYSDSMKIAGDIRVRYVTGAENNVKLWNIDDSMINRNRQVCEVFLLPFNYYFIREGGFRFHAGAGLYYDYSKLNENGYFDDSSFYEPPGEENYSAYTNDFTAHALGPLLDIGVNYKKGIFYGAFSFGSVPIHYMSRKQSWKLSPFMKPDPSYSVASKSVFGPYFYANLDAIINLKYVSLFVSLLGEYSRMRYTAAGYDDEGWADVEIEIANKVLSIEASILIPLGQGGIQLQIGYGRSIDDSGGKNNLLLGVRKEWF
jgi:hypothetical protein